MTLQLKSYLSSGRLSDVFSATLGEKLVVVKLVDLETFDRNALADGYDFASAELAITREIALYLHQLAQLQDDIVARCHGVYVGQTHQPWMGLRQLRPVLALILDDVGNSIAQDWRDIPHSLR